VLTLSFRRVSPTHHEFAYARADGSGEALTLETRSFLEHDFIHLALESEARLTEAFFGLLDTGHSYAELSGKAETLAGGPEARIAEIVIGPLAGVVREQSALSAAEFCSRVADYMSQIGEQVPVWLTPETISRAKERFRRLNGEWKATRFGETMRVTFPPSA
jgi:hypothetical protein